MDKIIIICILGLAVQTISSQCVGNTGIAFPIPCRSPVVTSAVLGPGGMTICSDDLLISGPIVVAGKLPFSGTVTLEGLLPAAGAGAVNYDCGQPSIGVVRQTPLGLVTGYEFRV